MAFLFRGNRRHGTDRRTRCRTSCFFVKRSDTWCSAPSRHGHHRGAQVHGAHQAASHVPALYLPSCSRYSFTNPERMEGWVSPGPGCKEQLAHGCYTTAHSQRTRTRGRWSSALTTRPPRHCVRDNKWSCDCYQLMTVAALMSGLRRWWIQTTNHTLSQLKNFTSWWTVESSAAATSLPLRWRFSLTGQLLLYMLLSELSNLPSNYFISLSTENY